MKMKRLIILGILAMGGLTAIAQDGIEMYGAGSAKDIPVTTNDTSVVQDLTYDDGTGMNEVLVGNPEYLHRTTTQNIADATNATVDQHYSSIIDMDTYLYAGIQLTGSSDGSGVTFKAYATLNADAATPADGAATPSADWVDVSTAVFGAASITLDSGNSGIYWIDEPTVLGRIIFQYEPDNATNSSDIFIKTAY